MAKFTDYYSSPEVRTIMEGFVERFPALFEGFDVNGVGVVITKKKRSKKIIRLVPVRYPADVFCDKPYIAEVFESRWANLDAKRKNLAVFHFMCEIPAGGFDPSSSHYARKVRPDIEMFMAEFAASGGVPNWIENPAAVDPMSMDFAKMDPILKGVEAIPDDVERVPVTSESVASPRGKSAGAA